MLTSFIVAIAVKLLRLAMHGALAVAGWVGSGLAALAIREGKALAADTLDDLVSLLAAAKARLVAAKTA